MNPFTFIKHLIKLSRYKKIARAVQIEFKTPELLEQSIIFVDSQEAADIYVNAEHSLADYIVLGMVCLQHSVKKEQATIKVYNETTPKTEEIGVFYKTSYTKKSVDSCLFLQLSHPIDEIYELLYAGQYKFAMVGLATSMALMNHFAGISGAIIPEKEMRKIKFSKFDDTIEAQKDALILLKYLVGSMAAGTCYAIEHNMD